jgi:succinate dehydrogenase/fumarate reductase flavoprotein subunit
VGEAGLHAAKVGEGIDAREIIRVVKDEMLPYEKVIFRIGEKLARSIAELDRAWRAVRDHLCDDPVKSREVAALVATARWCYSAAPARNESRGMHQRDDAPFLDPAQVHRLMVGGLDEVWVRPQKVQQKAL